MTLTVTMDPAALTASRQVVEQQTSPSELPARLTARSFAAALRRGPQLRHLLVLLDLTVAAFAWRLAQLLDQPHRVATRTEELLLVAAVAGATVLLAGASQLYRARVCSLRSVEIQRVA